MQIPGGAGWLHEVKHDGFRILVRKLGERAKVWSRRGADFTDRFSAIAEADRALIDGEADDGRSDFGALLTKRGGAQASLVAFDLLRLAEGEVVFAKACELGLEGIVSKRAGSFYKSGKSRNWLKTINPDFVRT
jgi:bifunctional non-homologous end joining protein LigD